MRFSLGNYATLAASAARRAVRAGESIAVARPTDLPAVLAACLGKVEFESFEEGRELEIVTRLARRSVLEVFRRRLRGADLEPLVRKFDQGLVVETGDLLAATDLLRQLGDVPGLGRLLSALDVAEEPGTAAAAIEFALEGLHLSRRLDRTETGGLIRYEAG